MPPAPVAQARDRGAQGRELGVAADQRREDAPLGADPGAVQALLVGLQLEDAERHAAALARGSASQLAVGEGLARRAPHLGADVDRARPAPGPSARRRCSPDRP